jgi:hypothetical protein
MNCLECEQAGTHRTAIALCHNCSAALCLEHAKILAKNVEMIVPLFKTVPLPIQAQVIFCRTCHTAITQPHLMTA